MSPALPGKLADCVNQDPEAQRAVPRRGDSAGGSAKAGSRSLEFQAIMPLRGKDPEDVGSGSRTRSPRRKRCTTSVSRSASSRARATSASFATTRYPQCSRTRIRRAAHRHAPVRTVPAALPPARDEWLTYVAMPPLYRIDAGKEVFYALDDAEREATLQENRSEERSHQADGHALQRAGQDEPLPAFVKPPSILLTRRLVQFTVEAKDDDGPVDGQAARQEARFGPPRAGSKRRATSRTCRSTGCRRRAAATPAPEATRRGRDPGTVGPNPKTKEGWTNKN